MKYYSIGAFALVQFSAAVTIAVCSAEIPGADQRENRLVGTIDIEGNVFTRDRHIREQLCIYPNTPLREEDLRWSELKLAVRFRDRFAWWNGMRPRLLVEEPLDGGRYWNVRVIIPPEMFVPMFD